MTAAPHHNKKWLRWLPLAGIAAFLSVTALLLLQGADMRAVNSALVGKPVPAALAGLQQKELSKGVVLVNFFASWCVSCVEDQAVFARAAAEDHLRIFGIAYKDRPQDTRQWLQEHGNPFAATGDDPQGQAALQWGVYGVPETYVIVDGTVQARYAGAVTQDLYDAKIKPLLAKGGTP